MIRRSLRVAGALLALALSPYGHRQASAGGQYYSWSPLVGRGYYETDPHGGPMIDFTTSDASLSIYYDPSSYAPPDSYIEVGSGVGMVPSVAAYELSFLPVAGGRILTATGYEGTTIEVVFTGDPGPLASNGSPESLAGFANNPVTVVVTGGYHIGYAYTVQSVPEPSSLLMLALGIGGASIALVRRRQPSAACRPDRRPASTRPRGAGPSPRP